MRAQIYIDDGPVKYFCFPWKKGESRGSITSGWRFDFVRWRLWRLWRRCGGRRATGGRFPDDVDESRQWPDHRRRACRCFVFSAPGLHLILVPEPAPSPHNAVGVHPHDPVLSVHGRAMRRLVHLGHDGFDSVPGHSGQCRPKHAVQRPDQVCLFPVMRYVVYVFHQQTGTLWRYRNY